MIDTLAIDNNKFPKGGDIYEALENVEINYIIHHVAPYTIGGKCRFPERQRFIVCPPVLEYPLGFYCIAIAYDQMEEELIPEAEKLEPTYSNYSLFVTTQILNLKFKKLDLLPITYLKGDATEPIGEGLKVIAHICNDIGGWGKGFVSALSKTWKRPEK